MVRQSVNEGNDKFNRKVIIYRYFISCRIEGSRAEDHRSLSKHIF